MSNTVKVAFGFFLVFFAYFCFTSYFLPKAAGPDFSFSRAAADFYYSENRMATVPADEDKMVFSGYGNSRLLRPPLGFYLPAQMAKLPILKDVPRFYAYRIAIAMLAGLTVMLIFLALKAYFNDFRYAVFGTSCAALMPQFSFYASYFSDDMIAFFASSLLVYCMVLIVKQGISLKRQLLFSFAAGLSVVSKPTAWIFLGPAIGFYLIFMLDYSKEFFNSRHFYWPLGLMTTVFIIAGGWWLLFNMYHYGPSEIILSKTIADMSARHSTLDLSQFGFAAQGIGMKQLLFLNHKNFLGATYIAFVGNLDWLRLRVGPLQYAFYLWLVIGFVLNGMVLAYQTVQHFIVRIQGVSFESFPRLFVFEYILYIAILLQFVLYTRLNVYMDIQIQGKYLMTMFIPMLILALSFFQKSMSYLKNRFEYIEVPFGVKWGVLAILFALPIVVHLDALVDHVIPFYWPDTKIPLILSWL